MPQRWEKKWVDGNESFCYYHVKLGKRAWKRKYRKMKMDNVDSYGLERRERKLRAEERKLKFETWVWEMEERVDNRWMVVAVMTY